MTGRDTEVLAGLARLMFALGALVSLGDGLTTWWVLSRVGVGVEGNPWMAEAMSAVGIGTVCAARVLVGTVAFWFLSRRIVGRHVRISTRRARRLSRWEAGSLSGPDRLWRWWDLHSAGVEFGLALVITAAVVGNNARAVLTLAGAGS